jgi:KipI family sensor histidine kinase inhibitor
MGREAVLVEAVGVDPAAWSLGLRRLELPGIIEIVPAAETILVRCDSAEAVADVMKRFTDVRSVDGSASKFDGLNQPVEIPVMYDGDDIDQVAESTNLSVASVIDLHAAASYHVAFCGFAPGFGYLRGLPAALQLPRRTTPRTRVPVGSVAIASEFSAVYPSASPGGWHIIGHTDLLMFDASEDPPSVLQPGMRVRFVRQ